MQKPNWKNLSRNKKISIRDGAVKISGPDSEPVRIAGHLIRELLSVAEKGHEIPPAVVGIERKISSPAPARAFAR